MRLRTLSAPAAALVVAAAVLAPAREADAFSPLGFSLGLAQRDVRVFPDFADAVANDNLAPHPEFPGYDGAVRAIWKGAIEWGSELHGTGGGDPTQPGGLGGSDANFDPTFQGVSNGVGAANDNIQSPLHADGGGTYAFAESPSSGGWRIRYYEHWTWSDGPGDGGLGGGVADLQGVATHEYGHALGLGHSGTGGATMFPSISSSASDNARSTESDDRAGLQAIYGVKSADKPRVSGLSLTGDLLTISGEDFAESGNEVWFTQRGFAGNGDPIRVTGLASTDGGTRIELLLPYTAGSGDVLVRRPGDGHADLSNAWPFDSPNGTTPAGHVGLSIIGSSASTVPAIAVDGPTRIHLYGTGFFQTQNVVVDGILLSSFPPEFAALSDSELVVDIPPLPSLGPVNVTIETANDAVSTQITVVANDPPVLEVANSTPAFQFTSLPVPVYLSAEPGDVYILALSRDDLPTVVPGVVSFDIGNGFTSLFLVAGAVIPENGWVELEAQFPSAPPGTTLYWQGAVLDADVGDFPLVESNVQTTIHLF